MESRLFQVLKAFKGADGCEANLFVFHVYRPTVFSGSRACSATLCAVSRWKRACSRTENYCKQCKAEGFLKMLLGVFIVFVKTLLKIPNLCSSDICGRLIIRGDDIL